MLKRGTVRIPAKKFATENAFFISIFILPDDKVCRTSHHSEENHNSTVTKKSRMKHVSVRLTQVPMHSGDNNLLLPILLPTFLILTAVIGSAVLFYLKLRILESRNAVMDTSLAVSLVNTAATEGSVNTADNRNLADDDQETSTAVTYETKSNHSDFL